MGASWLLHWQPASGSHLSFQTYGDVVRAVDMLPSSRLNKWTLSCSLHRPIARGQSDSSHGDTSAARELFGVSFSELPQSHFFVLRHEKLVVQAESSIQQLMEKVQMYRHRATISFEGFNYSFGDFVLRVGRAVLSTNESLLGIVMEVEYLPTCYIDQARLVLQEFFSTWQQVVSQNSLNGHFVLVEPNFADYSLPKDHGWTHTALQYVLVSAHFLAGRS